MTQQEKVLAYIHLISPYHMHIGLAKAEEIIKFSDAECETKPGIGMLMLFLLEAHPEQAIEWEVKYKIHIAKARECQKILTDDLSHPGWSDYAICHWLVFGDRQSLLGIVDCINDPGVKGDAACTMVRSMMDQCQKFKVDFLSLASIAPQSWDAANKSLKLKHKQ